MNILVSGASGYIGSAMVPKLREMKYSVIGIDKIKPKININYFEDFIIDDLSELKNINFINSEIDMLVHLAGESSIDAKSTKQYKDNYIASKNLYMWCLDRKIKKILMLSTVKVYDEGSYSESKKMSESLLIELCNQKGAQYTILRSTPIYGVGMKGGLANWLETYDKLLVPDVRNSESIIEMIGVNDLCDAILFCLENPTVDNQIYEISDNIDYKIKEIDQFVRSLLGKNKKYILLPRSVLWLVSKLAALTNKIGLNIPFSTNRYHILYKNTRKRGCSFFQDHGIVVKDNFFNKVPLIMGKKKP